MFLRATHPSSVRSAAKKIARVTPSAASGKAKSCDHKNGATKPGKRPNETRPTAVRSRASSERRRRSTRCRGRTPMPRLESERDAENVGSAARTRRKRRASRLRTSPDLRQNASRVPKKARSRGRLRVVSRPFAPLGSWGPTQMINTEYTAKGGKKLKHRRKRFAFLTSRCVHFAGLQCASATGIPLAEQQSFLCVTGLCHSSIRSPPLLRIGDQNAPSQSSLCPAETAASPRGLQPEVLSSRDLRVGSLTRHSMVLSCAVWKGRRHPNFGRIATAKLVRVRAK